MHPRHLAVLPMCDDCERCSTKIVEGMPKPMSGSLCVMIVSDAAVGCFAHNHHTYCEAPQALGSQALRSQEKGGT